MHAHTHWHNAYMRAFQKTYPQTANRTKPLTCSIYFSQTLLRIRIQPLVFVLSYLIFVWCRKRARTAQNTAGKFLNIKWITLEITVNYHRRSFPQRPPSRLPSRRPFSPPPRCICLRAPWKYVEIPAIGTKFPNGRPDASLAWRVIFPLRVVGRYVGAPSPSAPLIRPSCFFSRAHSGARPPGPPGNKPLRPLGAPDLSRPRATGLEASRVLGRLEKYHGGCQSYEMTSVAEVEGALVAESTNEIVW